MDRSISWTDPEVLLRLLEDAARKEAPRPKPATVEQEPAPPKPSPEPEPEPEFAVVDGTIDERVEALVEWLAKSRALEGSFITDAHGLAIVNRGADSDHVAICATLMDTLGDVRRLLTSDAHRMAISIGDARVLHLVTVETNLGVFGVGMVSRDYLSDEFLARAERALAMTLAGDDDGQ